MILKLGAVLVVMYVIVFCVNDDTVLRNVTKKHVFIRSTVFFLGTELLFSLNIFF